MKRIASSFYAALAAAALFAAEPAYDTLIAHRGTMSEAPENTMPAFRLAAERGFGFECDVQLSKDGRVFTFHDGDFKRVTAGACTNRCSDMTWEEICNLDVWSYGKWKGTEFAPERPALLEEVLDLARDGRWIYVEVKTSAGTQIVPYIRKIFDSRRKATSRNVLFIAFSRDICKALKSQMPGFKVFLLTYATEYWGKDAPPLTPKFVLDALRETGADGVDCMYRPEIVTADLVKSVRAAGREFHVWTVDGLTDALEAFRRGVQTVTTNRSREILCESKGNPCPSTKPIRIMSYNIRSTIGMDKECNPVRTAMRIMSESPDFACLNEVRGRAQCEQLARLTGMRGTYADVGGFSNAILSREVPISTETVELPCGKWKRSLLVCEFRDFVVASTHLDVTAETNRFASVPIVKATLEKYGKPFFVTGDWNAQPGTRVVKAMKEFTTIITPESGILTCHPHRYDRKTCIIDYIAMGGTGAERYEVLRSYGVRDYWTSDHAPVVAVVKARQ